MSAPLVDTAIRPMEPAEAKRVGAFVERVFHEFVAPDFEPEGVEEFLSHTRPDAMLERLQKGNLILLAESGGGLAGMIEMRNNSHISLFFVAPSCHNQGLGKRLLGRAIQDCRCNNPELEAVTVNSSLYAVPIYERLGFAQTQEEQLKNGIRFVPMQKRLRCATCAGT